MNKMVMGLETEYGSFSPDVDFTDTAKKLMRQISGEDNIYLWNGGRLYIDTGDHLEYCTPECLDPYEIVAWHFAGDRLINRLIKKVSKELKIKVYRNNSDFQDSSTFGCHENYLIPRSTDFERIKASLLGFIVTRQILFGSGRWKVNDFRIWQRQPFIEDTYSQASTFRRPLINLRDQALAPPEKFRRLHIISGDSNVSQWANFVKMGTTSLLLSMLIETEVNFDDLAPEYPLGAALTVSKDTKGNRTFPIYNGKQLTALQTQYQYFEAVNNWLKETTHALDWKFEVIDQWQRGLENVFTNPESLLGDVDWITKRHLIEEAENLRIFEDKNDYASLDLFYHDIDPETSLYVPYQDKATRFVEEEEIDQATKNPPAFRRARQRGYTIKRFGDLSADWEEIRINGSRKTMLFSN